MGIEIKKNIELPRQQPGKTQQKDVKTNELTQEQMKTFLRQYELKALSLEEMFNIYKKNALTPYFQNTLKSALILVFAPAITNLYYTFRPNSPLSGIMPFVMPLICLAQYTMVINKDFQRFCFNDTEDSKQLRNKYKILYAYSVSNKIMDDVVQDIMNLEQKQKKQVV